MQQYILNPYRYEEGKGFVLKDRVPGNAEEIIAEAAAAATKGKGGGGTGTNTSNNNKASGEGKKTISNSVALKQHSKQLLQSTAHASSNTGSSKSMADGGVAAGAQARAGVSVDDALNSLFPPEDAGTDPIEGVPMMYVASKDHADKMDIIHLQESLEQACTTAGARPQGVCALREQIYTDALDEVIRQVTIKHPERGLLLAELRDEVKETNTTYGLLFDAASQFGVRKEIERDLKRTMQSQLETLTVDVSVLDHRVNETKAKYEGLERMFQERRAAEEKKHAEEVAFLKKGNGQLQTEIKRWGAS